MLNPPYKADKKNDVEELEFVKWNLEALVEGGTCVAIVPMQCAISTKDKTVSLKKELLDKHTLEAVFSMPDELFYNSDKSVVTCIMVFTAHKPHPKDKETFFGYFKDDGFEKRKNLGRIDVHNKWGKIKEEWLRLYRNRKEVAGKSVMHHVEAKDEWCAEAYMETDYNGISKPQFEKTIRDYIAFKIYSDMNFSDVIYTPLQDNARDLKTDTWEWSRLDFLFSIEAGHYYYPSEYSDGETPYCSASAENNGIGKLIDLLPDFDGNKLIVGKIKCSTFYQSLPFCATSDVNVLTPKFKMSVYIGLFIATVIEMSEGYKWNYGRQCRVNDTKKNKNQTPRRFRRGTRLAVH